ncbi:uncharacterized protein LOC132257885 [Phlebotomus argentipes]|uniref:uncharacterized protein LOC132257885 n=1 Tax=Phlebotomus argentipes TaxID=94469 RepID=UPI0028936874|nr:uncharacterized protein LOC132257885 [Phlebotomus argentipes]
MDLFKELNDILESFSNTWDVPGYMGKPFVEGRLHRMSSQTPKPKVITAFFLDNLEREFIPEKSFNELRREMTDLGNGLFKKTLTEGFGDVLQNNKMVTLHFSSYKEGNATLSNSSYLAQEPVIFVLGKEKDLLPGFEKAVRTMRNQEKAHFIIPRMYSQGAIAEDPDNLKDEFVEIEIVRVATHIPENEKIRLLTNFNMALDAIRELRRKGKAAFSAGFYRAAAFEYISILLLLMNSIAQNHSENDQRLQLLVQMCLNCGIAFNKIGIYDPSSAVLHLAYALTDNGVPAEDTLKGKICLHACRAFRLSWQRENKEATEYFYRARNYLGDIPEIKAEHEELRKFYNTYMTLIALDKPISDMFKSKYPRSEAPIALSKSQKFFEDLFDPMLKDFMRSKDNKREFFAVHGNFDIEWAKDVATKYKRIKLKVHLNEELNYVRYVVTKK